MPERIANSELVVVGHQSVAGLGPTVAKTSCPYCLKRIVTRVESYPGLGAYLGALGICMAGYVQYDNCSDFN